MARPEQYHFEGIIPADWEDKIRALVDYRKNNGERGVTMRNTINALIGHGLSLFQFQEIGNQEEEYKDYDILPPKKKSLVGEIFTEEFTNNPRRRPRRRHREEDDDED